MHPLNLKIPDWYYCESCTQTSVKLWRLASWLDSYTGYCIGCATSQYKLVTLPFEFIDNATWNPAIPELFFCSKWFGDPKKEFKCLIKTKYQLSNLYWQKWFSLPE